MEFIHFFENRRGCHINRQDSISLNRDLVLLVAQELEILFAYILYFVFFCSCNKHVCEVGVTGIHSALVQEMDHGAWKKLTEYIALANTSQFIPVEVIFSKQVCVILRLFNFFKLLDGCVVSVWCRIIGHFQVMCWLRNETKRSRRNLNTIVAFFLKTLRKTTKRQSKLILKA